MRKVGLLLIIGILGGCSSGASAPPVAQETVSVLAEAGQVIFVVGDNRDHSKDSRTIGAIAEHDLVGRLVGHSLAFHDGIIDWDRIGTPID